MASLAAAHPGHIAAAKAKVQPDGAFELRVRFDVLSYCLDISPTEVAEGPLNALLDGPEETLETNLSAAKDKFLRNARAFGDGRPVKFDSITFPTAKDIKDLIADKSGTRLPVMGVAILTGHFPKGAKTSSFAFPPMVGTVILTTEFPYQEPITEPVEAGANSIALTIPTVQVVREAKSTIEQRLNPDPAPTPKPANESKPTQPAPAAAKPKTKAVDPENPFQGASASAQILSKSKTASPAVVTPDVAEAEPPSASIRPETATPVVVSHGPAWYRLFPGYVKLGFLHILPYGLDHILFVIGLFLLSTRTKDLLKQVTAFTVAHSLTLGLSLYGVVRLPSSVVEPIIALSIVFIAVENLLTSKLHKWRPAIVFLFGLVHGLGFASVLQDMGLTRGNFLTALFGFNIGVELGQLSVIAAAFLLVGWLRSHRSYRTWVTMPASLAIAVVAAFWTIERLL